MLMATRASRLSAEHVQALNMIDIAFYGSLVFGLKWQSSNEKAVCRAWRDYFDSLEVNSENLSDNQNSRLVELRNDKFIALLASIAKEQNYDFDSLDLRKYMYSPIAHGQIEDENNAIRHGMAELFRGKRPFPMYVVNLPTPNQPASTDPAKP